MTTVLSRNVASNGYVRVRVPGHPEADRYGWAYEHRMIAHDAFGPISPDGHVHHKNHDKTDNRLSNLEVLTRQEHTALHASEKRLPDDEIARLYVSGLTTVQVASRLGCSGGAVSRSLARSGVKVRPKARVPVDDAELRRLHAMPGTRVPQIAASLGVGVQVVRRRMVELGLPSFPAGRPA